MAEILYQYLNKAFDGQSSADKDIRWLTEEDYDIFVQHLALCGQKPISVEVWENICRKGIPYCGLFKDGTMIARACREIITPDQWEIADVRVVKDYRNQGYAYRICSFVLSFILEEGKRPTIRTEEDNFAMQKVIDKLGFTKCKSS